MSWVNSGNLIIVGSKEKINSDFTNNKVFTGIDLKYITAPELVLKATELGIGVKPITLSQTLNKIWIEGTPTEISRFYQLLNTLDRKENFPDIGTKASRSTYFKQYDLKYVTAELASTMFTGLGIPVFFNYTTLNPKCLFVSGPTSSMAEFEGILAKIDVKENTNNPTNGDFVGITKYVLKYISYADAENLLTYSKLGITVMDLKSFPKTIFFFGARSFRDEALKLLKSVDNIGQDVTEIIDYASSSSKLAARRNLICEISGLSVSNFVISEDVDRNPGASKYILYYIGTESEIAKIRQVVSLIDSPLGGS